MPRRRLVVIGNGMAGARTVEEILERGGRALFDITMFGDEPHGNYNRILLSTVLSGDTAEDGIVLNDTTWYASNGIDLHAGPGYRIARIDRYAKMVSTVDGQQTPYDLLIIATGSRPYPTSPARTRPGGDSTRGCSASGRWRTPGGWSGTPVTMRGPW
jgi:nitrite reductase (NADH) large subunit